MTTNKSNSSPLTRADLLLATLAGLCALALYIRTLAPSLLWGDSAEFQTLAYTLGMTHPSGYMSYILIGKLFTWIPLGNIAYRVNLMSAFFGALAVAQVYLIGRLLNGWRVAAISSVVMLALTEGFWWRALIAESYTIAASMIASVWLLVLLWKRTGKWKYLFAAGWVGGISIGIHSTIVLTAASVLVFMVLTARTKSAWMGALAGAFLGMACTLAAFLILDHIDPPSSIYNTLYRPSLSTLGLTESDFDTPLERLFVIFPAKHFWTYYFSATPAEIRARLAEYLTLFPVWEFVLILIGVIAVFLRSHWYNGLYPLIGFLLVWGLAITVDFSIYREFYVPALIFVSIWMCTGASALLEGLDRLLKWIQRTGRTMRFLILGATSLTLFLVPFWESRQNIYLAVEKGYTQFVARDHIYPVFSPDKAIQDARKMLARLEPDAVVFTDWDKLYSLIYTAQFEADRADVTFHMAFITEQQILADSAIAYIDSIFSQRPIYFTVLPTQLGSHYQLEEVGNGIYRLQGK